MTGAAIIVLLALGPASPPGDGAFGFPQAEAVVLCDRPDLRVSVYNDAVFLYVQAVVWGDGNDALGQTRDGRSIGDCSYLSLDVNADGVDSADVDRIYSLNPWPARLGLQYQVSRGTGRTTKFQRDSQGRGAIRYVDAGDRRRVRVDSYLIPLSEIVRVPGQTIRLACWIHSPQPTLTINSTTFRPQGPYYLRAVPRNLYHELTLADRAATIDPSTVPHGRSQLPTTPVTPIGPIPPVGAAPPELVATDWINADTPPRLADLRGDVVLIEFWSTSCGTCLDAIDHLNDLHERYADRGLHVLGITSQSRAGVEWFMKKKPMRYPLGTGSPTQFTWGAPIVPYTFLIGRDGRVLWRGKPVFADLENRIVAALASK